MVLGRAERVSAQMETTHERERPQSLGLAHDFFDQWGRLPASGRQQDPHARSEKPDRVLYADGTAHDARAGSGRPGQHATEAVEREDARAKAHLARITAGTVLDLAGPPRGRDSDARGIDGVRSAALGVGHDDRGTHVGPRPVPDRACQVRGRVRRRAEPPSCPIQAGYQ